LPTASIPNTNARAYAAEALTNFAFAQNVRVLRAHALPEANASTRVLTKCGFHHLGEVIEPEDGLVWRWEKRGEQP
jgi:RimJ/RimL family protein N-acetyltransferase